MIRVFPRRTRWTPDDELAFVGDPPFIGRPKEDFSVKISVSFTWDLPEAERLYRSWKRFYSNVEIGGPATGQREEQFVPGRFLKKGAVITSRGCHNQCWFCEVWKRNGSIQELPITDGHNVIDDNLLACSQEHIRRVFEMLHKQNKQSIFSGGWEAKLLKDWHIELLTKIKLAELFFAYDTEDDYEPLIVASNKLKESGFIIKNHTKKIFAYCLIGYKGDTQKNAQERMLKLIRLGITPMAMLYRDNEGRKDTDWAKFQRLWARPWNIYGQIKSRNALLHVMKGEGNGECTE